MPLKWSFHLFLTVIADIHYTAFNFVTLFSKKPAVNIMIAQHQREVLRTLEGN